jgi:DNA-binding transcriptional MerR regulator
MGTEDTGRVRSWEQRLADPTEPLYTMAVVAELLDIDQQVIRRLDVDGIMQTARPSGNQRRYSRDDVALIAYALSLQEQGIPRTGIARILELERSVALLAAEHGHTVEIVDTKRVRKDAKDRD